ncbi:PASTA domain-containing protein [Rhizobium leguminosarum]|uniref:PASTA domain-containing protein n=1 Tax=Rhizobium leguminosarum TaxID=384 RepID=UPI001C93B45B|nr:PASTA domain-containing protein [Rhizobium leguminosarum]MBY5619690.1 PASTA domain-containing protein [Rhizobium leguminosarum]
MNFAKAFFRTAALLLILGCFLPPITAASAAITIALPDLLGKDKDEAIRLLDQLGLRHQLGVKNTCEKENTISQQQPVPGTVLPVGSVILLWVNRDSGALVPDLVGKNLEQAKEALASIGLEADPQETLREIGDLGCPGLQHLDLGFQPQTIVRINPPAGTAICRPAKIQVYRVHVYNVGSGRNSNGFCP